MVEVILTVLASGAGEYINKSILIGILFVFVHQMLLRKRVYLNALTSSALWVLAVFGLFFSIVGFGDMDAIKRFFIAPVLLFFSGWEIVECSNGKNRILKVKNAILAIMVGYCIHALLNYSVNIGNERWRLIDYYSGTYRAATGLGVINTLAFSTLIYCLLEKNIKRKIVGLICFSSAVLYGLQVGSRTQLLIFLVVTIVCLIFYFYQVDNKKAARVALVISVGICGIFVLAFQTNFMGMRKAIEMSNLFYRVNADTSYGDGVRIDSLLRGLNSLIEYPLGNASQFYFHNMWLDAGRVCGIIAFVLITAYTIITYCHAFSIVQNRFVEIEFRVLILGVYLGLFLNYFVEPVLEGMTDNFYIFCLINGVVDYLFMYQDFSPPATEDKDIFA